MARRILLISLGSIGRRHLRNVRKMLPDAEICIWRHRPGDTPSEADGAAFVYSAEDALSFAPDAVLISSPASFHAEQCALFCARGIPVFVEKPLEVSQSRLAPLHAALSTGGGKLFVGYVLRFQPVMAALRQALDDGVVGKVRLAHIATGQYLPDWRADADYRDGVSAQAALGGGVLLELSHEVDYARWFFGQPQSVTAETGRFSGLDMDVEDAATMVLGYPDKQVSITVDFLQRVPAMTLKVTGSEGTLHADLITETARISTPAGEQVPDLPKMESGNEMYLRQLDAFLCEAFDDYAPAFEGSRNSPHAGFEDAGAVLGIVDAARLSALEGRRISL
ncbi:Gfo/Idh/MocA family protein [Roseobacter ponti]|uniref:Gfo/Idh/MocA family oxidoreductase n=1 Tax=Roseobacter ponti TaxID=1891787 RepID=A0A858SYZ5_9RHOB|nr:Gfo/Idh/MocA family oxidoreductase [Roseobacter ponti]QJF52873.1 Gfo/Idh/MocA family oxidoreductase [Roseobacter ponti]